MRLVAVAALPVMLAACAPGLPDAPAVAPVIAAMPQTDTCGAAPHAGLVGQPATALERVLILRPVRLIRGAEPAATLPGRIGFRIDTAERIVGIACG